MPYGETVPPSGARVVQVQVADRTPYIYDTSSGNISRPGSGGGSGFSQTGTVPNHAGPWHYTSYLDVGIFRDTLAPSLALHSGFALAAYGAGRYAARPEARNWLWPGGLVANAWWSSVGRFVIRGERSFGTALKVLAWPERLVLGGVTLWGLRSLARIARRSAKRSPSQIKAEEAARDSDWWNRALVSTFLPEAILQALVALPLTAPFRHQGGVLTGYHPYVQLVAVGVWGFGFGLGALADYEADQHEESGRAGPCNTGVWSIVQQPNHLGDALVHLAFPILLYASDLLAPVELLGPIANYIFVRYIGGDDDRRSSATSNASAAAARRPSEIERSRLAATGRNQFWPDAKQLQNSWMWTAVGLGVAVVGVERALWAWHLN